MEILGEVIGILGFLAALWLIPLYRKLSSNEKAIRGKENEIDAVEANISARTSDSLVNEKQRTAQVAKTKEPLVRELERLKQERQFILDKVPFFKK